MPYKNSIQVLQVGSDAVLNGDFTVSMDGKVTAVRVQAHVDSGYNVLVGWNEDAGKIKILPGGAETYAVDGGFIGGKLAINFEAGGAGTQKAVVLIYTQTGAEICD